MIITSINMHLSELLHFLLGIIIHFMIENVGDVGDENREDQHGGEHQECRPPCAHCAPL